MSSDFTIVRFDSQAHGAHCSWPEDRSELTWFHLLCMLLPTAGAAETKGDSKTGPTAAASSPGDAKAGAAAFHNGAQKQALIDHLQKTLKSRCLAISP